MKDYFNKHDCIALIKDKKLGTRYAIASIGGIDRFFYWDKKDKGRTVNSEPILSWDELYARLSAMEKLTNDEF